MAGSECLLPKSRSILNGKRVPGQFLASSPLRMFASPNQKNKTKKRARELLLAEFLGWAGLHANTNLFVASLGNAGRVNW